jgi:hypothetical protein
MERTGSNRSNMGESREQLWTKWQAEKEQAKEKEQESLGEDSKPTLQRGKGCWQCGKEGHIVAECPEQGRAAKSLQCVNNENKRQLWPEPCQAKQLLYMIVWKAPHQQVLEANQGDWQKELVVKSLVWWNCRELRGFLKQANHYCHFVKDYSVLESSCDSH